MKLFHGTSITVLDKILNRGVLPRGKRKGNWKDAPSRADCVYLTNAYAPYFALPAYGPRRDGVVLEIDTERLEANRLLPDEDALERVGRNTDGIEGNMYARVKHYRDRLELYCDGQWQASLDYMGTCSHLGTIPTSAITRVAIVPFDYHWFWDASVSHMNYRLMGGKYRKQMARLFGDPTTDDDEDQSLFANYWKIPMDHKIYEVVNRRLGKAISIKHPDERPKPKHLSMQPEADNEATA